MSLHERLLQTYPELKESTIFSDNVIVLQNDSDGEGDFIVKWDYEKPIPPGLKLGKSTNL